MIISNIQLLFVSVFFLAVSMVGTVFLFFRIRGIRARKILFYFFLNWTAVYAILVWWLWNGYPIYETSIPIIVLMSGMLPLYLFYLYVREVVGLTPLSHGTSILIGLPLWIIYLVIFVFFCVDSHSFVYYVSGEVGLGRWYDFDMLLRYAMIIVMVIFNVLSIRTVCVHQGAYQHYVENNYSESKYYNIAWLKVFTWLVSSIWIPFGIILCVGLRTGIFWYTILILPLWLYLMYKGLFQKSPLPAEIDEGKQSVSSEVDDVDVANKLEQLHAWMTSSRSYLNSRLRLKDVADAIGVSRSELSSIINSSGVNFVQFVNAYRITEACRLLANIRLTIDEVAFQSGFASRSAFYAFFKEQVNQSPSEYRKNLA